MTLERFHALFIGTCVLVSLVVGLWALGNFDWLLGIAAIVGGGALTLNSEIFRGRTEQADRSEALPLTASHRSA